MRSWFEWLDEPDKDGNVAMWYCEIPAVYPAWSVKISSEGNLAEMRQFETGATRNIDNNKHDPEGFISPLVIERFNEYMHSNRRQADGNIRDSDNWQKGIPKTAYMKSMWRHFLDVWHHHRGYPHKAKEPKQIALCGLMFNVMGMLHEELKEENQQVGTGEPGSIVRLNPQPLSPSREESSLVSPK